MYKKRLVPCVGRVSTEVSPFCSSSWRRMSATQTAVKEVIPEVGGNFTLDDNVIKRAHKV